MNPPRLITLVGIVNLTLLIYLTPLKNHEELFRADPLFFGWPGIVVIALWGLAYIASARHWQQLGLLMVVFALEKAFYATHWALWLGDPDNADRMTYLWQEDLLTALFLQGYGLWDGLCALYFLFLFIQGRKSPPSNQA